MSSRRLTTQFLTLLLLVGMTLGTSVFAHAKDKKKSSQKQEQTSSKVDINSASQADLEGLPGIGPAMAKKIIDNRPFKSVSDLSRAGIPENTIEKIRSSVKASRTSRASGNDRAETSEPSTEKSAASPQQETAPRAETDRSRDIDTKPSKTSRTSQPENPLPQSDKPADSTQAAPAAGSGMVWVNIESKVYHREGDRWYGKTKNGKYMSESDAIKAGYRASKSAAKKDKE